MPITQSLSSKGNVKKFTTNDLPMALQQPVIGSYYATSTASQTVINLPFTIVASGTNANTDIFWLFVDGKKLDLGSSNDFTFTAIGSDGSSSQVTLNQTLPSGLNIQAFKLGLKKELEFQTDNRFVQLYEYMGDNFQGCINPSEYTLTATTSAGTPPAGQFYSTVVNRAALIDLSQDLKARMGVERISTQQLYASQSEFGPNGEPVWMVQNDTFGQIRCVGNWIAADNSNGQWVAPALNTDTSSFVEITFYGTGLNVVSANAGGTAVDLRYSVDGGAESQFLNITPTNIYSGRNYTSNTVYPVVSGLSLGIHTVKVRSGSGSTWAAWFISGFETLNESSSVKVNSGVGYVQGKKYTSTSQSSFSYSSPVTGTRGGRVLIYQNSDGSVGTAFQAVNTSAAYLSSTDHTNEEIARTYYWREFGAGRSDDFSLIGTSSATVAAFTLDDGTTTLVGSQVAAGNGGNSTDLRINNTGGSAYFITFQFVGTGLDIMAFGDSAGTTTNYTLSVDGVSQGSLAPNFTVAGIAGAKKVPLCSGLPYGTHTVKIAQPSTSSANPINIRQFIAYQPKKPTLPSGSIELADYNVMANFVANATASLDSIGTGTLRKAVTREMNFVGSWAFGTWASVTCVPTHYVAGFSTFSGTIGNYFEYTFFGTGFEFRHTEGGGSTATVTLNGTTLTSANFGTATFNVVGTGCSFNSSTGVYTQGSSAVDGNSFSVSNLPLAKYTVRFTVATAANFNVDTIDVITPIHSYKYNLYADQQNSITVGSQAISDNRKITPVKDSLSSVKAWAQAIGVANQPTTTSGSPVPMPDMSLTIKTSGGRVAIGYSVDVYIATNGQATYQQLYVDGVAAGVYKANYSASSTGPVPTSDLIIVNLSPGVHKIDLYWWTSASNTGTLLGVQRSMYAFEF